MAIVLVICVSCATSKMMLDEDTSNKNYPTSIAVEEAFFITGSATTSKSENVLKALKKVVISTTALEKHVLFIGDNTNAKKGDTVALQKDLDRQIAVTSDTEALSHFIPGNYDWGFDHSDGLEVMEDYLTEKLGREDPLVPNNGCPLESEEIGDTIQLIVVDSQWFLEDWDKHPKMNDKCDEIKTREKFLSEVEGELKKNANKLILFAMHHPLYTNGIHGGRFSGRDHIFPLGGNIPLPGVATLLNQVRAQGAPSIQDNFNIRYKELVTSLLPMLNDPEKQIVVVSGHEQNLQYIEEGTIKQLISGAAANAKPATISDNGIFSYGSQGFSVVERMTNGAVWITMYGVSETSETSKLFQKEILPSSKEPDFSNIPKMFPKSYNASVYEVEETDKSDFFKSFWGDHYREVYGTKVEAPTALLDTLYGGLEVVRPGGGHQTRSLRLVAKDGKEYNMRALKKSATQFLETTAFKGTDGDKYFSNTVTADLISDFYTAAHPYGAFAIPTLAEAAGIYYTTPQLFYVPQQKALGKYSQDYGNQLYMIVERPAEEYKKAESFGAPDDIKSTDDLLASLREDEKYRVDEASYIRARIFDMLIGDWDRHSDQWRWAAFEEGESTTFKPIPRDRDQVFANFDGKFLNALRSVMGGINQFGVYGPDIENIEWFNLAGSKLDRALIQRSSKEDWMKQAAFLQTAISEKTLNKAFAQLPREVQDTTTLEIKRFFKGRQKNLASIVERYYKEFLKFQMLRGTDKDDLFEITRSDFQTSIKAYRIKDGEKGTLLFDRTFNSAETEEIWVYGLDDDDVFRVTGTGKKPILIRIIGGQNKDVYDISEGKKIKIYDRNDKESEIKNRGGAHFRFTDFYEANLYDYHRKPNSKGTFGLSVGYNPDDGVLTKGSFHKEVNDYIENPYGRKFGLHVAYHSLTQGWDLSFEKSYAATFKDFNLFFDGRFTSDNFTQNFFGFGNETMNFDDRLSLDYNRVNLEMYNGGVGIKRESDYGSLFIIKYDLQTVEVVRDGANFISTSVNQQFGRRAYFGLPNMTYRYKNFNDETFPTKGMEFTIQGGAIDNLQSDALSGFVKSGVQFYNSLLSNNRLILMTKVHTHLTFGDQQEFYQSPTLGANTGLRGFRQQRFTGNRSLAGSADVSYSFEKFKTFLFPLDFDIYGGFDTGRVWIDGEDSTTWHSAYGGGMHFKWTEALRANFSAFNGDEGLRVGFGLQLSY